MSHPFEAMHRGKHLPELVFINFNKDDRNPTTKLSVINTHCSLVSREQRRSTPQEKNERRVLQILIERQSPSTDSFSQLPIQKTVDIQTAFNFYAHVYAAHISAARQRNHRIPSSGAIMSEQVMLQDAMVFEQTMAYSLAMRSVLMNLPTRMTPPILQYSTKASARLRDRLQSPHKDDHDIGAIIMTTHLLAATYLACGEYDTAVAHAKGLQSIVTMQGGYSKLGWDGHLEMKAKQ